MSEKQKSCCEKCLIDLDYKEKNRYQCNNRECDCHTPRQDKVEEAMEYVGKHFGRALKKLGEEEGEGWNKRQDEYCPHCGYYCTGKTAFCTKGLDTPLQSEGLWERFRKIGDGSGRFIATRQEVFDFIEAEIALARGEAVKPYRDGIATIAKDLRNAGLTKTADKIEEDLQTLENKNDK